MVGMEAGSRTDGTGKETVAADRHLPGILSQSMHYHNVIWLRRQCILGLPAPYENAKMAATLDNEGFACGYC